MNVFRFDVVVVVLWSADGFFGRVYVRVHVDGCAVDIEVEDVEDFELLHEWFCMCLWWSVADEPDDFLVCSVEWLDVCLV